MKPDHGASTSLLYAVDLRPALSKISDLDIGEKIPGFRTSAVFFTALRTNILLSETSLTPLPSSYHSRSIRPRRPDTLDSCQRRVAPSSVTPTTCQSQKSQSLQEHHAAPRLDTTLHLDSYTSSPTTSSPRKSRPSTPPSPSPAPLHWLQNSDVQPVKARALRLLASSVSQQSHTAFNSILTHPISLLFWTILLFLTRNFLCFLNPVACQNITVTERTVAVAPPVASRNQHPHRHQHSPMCGAPSTDDDQLLPKPGETIYDVNRSMRWFPYRVVIAWTIVTAVLLLLARFTSWMYRDLGREIMATSGNDDTGWLDADDELLVATATHTSAGLNTGGLDEGADIVGVLVLSWVAVSRIAGARRKKSGKAFVRGWAVRPDAQGKGIGRALLKEVVKVCVRERGAEGVWFADDFAHAQRPLHILYNGPFRRRDLHARQTLASVIDEVTHRWGGAGHISSHSHTHSHSSGVLRKR